MADTEKPTRGEINCNPCNIRLTKAHWLGKIIPGHDTAFEQFDSVEHGVRAACITIRNYHQLSGLSTIEEVINRWAPSSENDTSSYLCDVCQRLNAHPDTVINFSSPDQLGKLIRAIIRHENGRIVYTDKQIIDGVMMAFPNISGTA